MAHIEKQSKFEIQPVIEQKQNDRFRIVMVKFEIAELKQKLALSKVE